MIVDLDSKPTNRLNDLELAVKQWAHDEANKNKVSKGPWLPPKSKYANINGLQFGLCDDKGNRLDVRIDEDVQEVPA